jgi:competence protein ComEA
MYEIGITQKQSGRLRMRNRTETKSVRCYVLFFLAGLVGLSLILGNTPSYAQAQKTLIDLNTASEKELESIKGVGPATAKKIIEGRPYKSVDDLSKVGIPAKTIEGMKPQVKVGPPPIPAAKPAPAKDPAKVAPTQASPPAAKETPAKIAPTPQKAPTPAATAEKTTAKAAAPAKLAPGQKVNINTGTKEQLEALPEIGPVKAQSIIDGRPYKTPEDIMKVKGIKEGTFNKIKDYITVN